MADKFFLSMAIHRGLVYSARSIERSWERATYVATEGATARKRSGQRTTISRSILEQVDSGERLTIEEHTEGERRPCLSISQVSGQRGFYLNSAYFWLCFILNLSGVRL